MFNYDSWLATPPEDLIREEIEEDEDYIYDCWKDRQLMD